MFVNLLPQQLSRPTLSLPAHALEELKKTFTQLQVRLLSRTTPSDFAFHCFSLYYPFSDFVTWLLPKRLTVSNWSETANKDFIFRWLTATPHRRLAKGKTNRERFLFALKLLLVILLNLFSFSLNLFSQKICSFRVFSDGRIVKLNFYFLIPRKASFYFFNFFASFRLSRSREVVGYET